MNSFPHRSPGDEEPGSSGSSNFSSNNPLLASLAAAFMMNCNNAMDNGNNNGESGEQPSFGAAADVNVLALHQLEQHRQCHRQQEEYEGGQMATFSSSTNYMDPQQLLAWNTLQQAQQQLTVNGTTGASTGAFASGPQDLQAAVVMTLVQALGGGAGTVPLQAAPGSVMQYQQPPQHPEIITTVTHGNLAPAAGHHPRHHPAQDENSDPVNFLKRMNTLREAAIKRGSKIIPCRARGMSAEHNAHTAFFEVPKYEPSSNQDADDNSSLNSFASSAPKALHGLELVCSFPKCRNNGVKFLYCYYCGDAVSKRCFRSGHSHEDLVRQSRKQEMEDQQRDQQLAALAEEAVARYNDLANAFAAADRPEGALDDDGESAVDDDSGNDDDSAVAGRAVGMGVAEVSSSEESRKHASSSSNHTNHSRKRRREAQQPDQENSDQEREEDGNDTDDGDEEEENEAEEPMSQRQRLADGSLHEILNNSAGSTDDNTSSDGGDNTGRNRVIRSDPALDAEVSQMKSEWDALLEERQEMSSNDDVSDWLERVFAVSRRYKHAADRANAAHIV